MKKIIMSKKGLCGIVREAALAVQAAKDICTECGELKPIVSQHNRGPDGFAQLCKDCMDKSEPGWDKWE